jgi:hypothetical protein
VANINRFRSSPEQRGDIQCSHFEPHERHVGDAFTWHVELPKVPLPIGDDLHSAQKIRGHSWELETQISLTFPKIKYMVYRSEWLQYEYVVSLYMRCHWVNPVNYLGHWDEIVAVEDWEDKLRDKG